MRTAVVSYIYPRGLLFLPDFLQTLASQSDQDFELLIFNDGVEDLAGHLKDCKRNYTIFPIQGTVVEIRFQSFQTLSNTAFDQFIFQDIDDGMSENRIEKCRQLLHTYPFICNDLLLMDEKGLSRQEPAWAERLGDKFEFDHSFITDKNIAGLGNSAINKSLLKTPVLFHSSPLAADWFIFYQLLYLTGTRAIFTSGCQTLYRQHVNNSAGLKQADVSRLKNVVQVCKLHYEGLIETGYVKMKESHAAILKLENLLEQNNYNYAPPLNHEHLYWWEEKNYLYEKN